MYRTAPAEILLDGSVADSRSRAPLEFNTPHRLAIKLSGGRYWSPDWIGEPLAANLPDSESRLDARESIKFIQFAVGIVPTHNAIIIVLGSLSHKGVIHFIGTTVKLWRECVLETSTPVHEHSGRQNRNTASNRRSQQRSGTMMCGAGLHKDRRKSTAGLGAGDTRDGRAVHWKQSSESCNIYGVAVELELDCVRVRLPQVFHPEADARESWMHNEGEENGEAGGKHLTTNAHLCMYFREAQCAAMRPAYKWR
ncbi:hypothetical protein B0H13DRAFT_1915142 [Mycena leptocephala]|nr:hypothetical protein B0H13DRAFT_1915142 [Mycena leptocephala]